MPSSRARAIAAPFLAEGLDADQLRSGFRSPTAATLMVSPCGPPSGPLRCSYTRTQSMSIQLGVVVVPSGNQSSWMVWCIGPGGWCAGSLSRNHSAPSRNPITPFSVHSTA